MSERLRPVVEQLDTRPDDWVLDIWCGHGVAATLALRAPRRRSSDSVDRSVE